MLERVKIALRISHNLLDNDIESSISAARLELKRAGVSAEKAESDTDDLIILAVKTYCQAIYSPSLQDRQNYEMSFRYQLDNIRKSSGYMEVVNE